MQGKVASVWEWKIFFLSSKRDEFRIVLED
jgi:hypothetical protein